MLNGEHFQHPQCANFSVAKLLTTAITIGFFNPCCSAQFPCHDRVVIPNKRNNLVFVLHCCCCSWWAAAGPVTNVLFTARTITDPVSNWANIYGIFTIYASQTSISTGLVPPTIRNSVTTLSLIHISTTFTILLSYYVEHMWLDPCGAGQCHYLVQETLSGATFKRGGGKKSHYFCTDPNTHTETVKSNCTQQVFFKWVQVQDLLL